MSAFLNSLKVPVLPSDPASAEQGFVYLNSTTGKLRVYNGATWDEYSTGSTSSGPTYYPTTLSEANNTATQTDIMTFTIPANDMDEGDIIEVRMSMTIQQNSGGALTMTLRFGWHGVGGTSWIAVNAGSVASGSTTGSYMISLFLQRVGTALRLRGRSGSSAAELTIGALGNTPPSVTNNDASTSLNTPDFTSDISMYCAAKWSAADPTAIYKCTYAKAFKM